MPPKRKAAASPVASQPARGRGRGRGRGGASSSAVKKKKLPERECTLLLLDIGNQSNILSSDGKSALEKAKNIADWIISRRVFADSDKLINFGCHPSPSISGDGSKICSNTQFMSAYFEKPSIEFLRRIAETTSDGNNHSDVLEAIEGALELLEESTSAEYDDKITIAVLSNFVGLSGDEARVRQISTRLSSLNATLMLIGDDETVKKENPEALQLLTLLKDETVHTTCSFENALNEVSFFAQKTKSPRGYPFEFQLSEDFSISLQMFVKISEEKFVPKFGMKVEDDEQVAKIRQYEQIGGIKADDDGIKKEEESDDKPQNGGAYVVDRSEIIKGYHYGTSIIPFSKADKALAAVEKEGKQLQLIMFTKQENILPHYLTNECRWLLPNQKSNEAVTSMKALILAMQKEETVAIARYAYNINSNPRTVVLFPKLTKNGCPVFEHFTLPFNEDIRGFEFPRLDNLCEEATDYQVDTMEAYIDHFMLVSESKTEDGKKVRTERMKINQIRNPQSQHLCMSMKRKLLNLPPELDDEEHKALLGMISTPKDLLESSEKVVKLLAKSFDLKVVEKVKEAGFFNKPGGEFAADSDSQDMKRPKDYDDMDI